MRASLSISPLFQSLLVLLSLSLTARADEGPPADYQDPCVEAGIAESADCVRCRAPKFKDEACWETTQKAGKELACRAWSYAIFCTPGKAGPAGGETPSQSASSAASGATPKGGGCGCDAGGAPGAGLALLGLIAAGWLQRRRGRVEVGCERP